MDDHTHAYGPRHSDDGWDHPYANRPHPHAYSSFAVNPIMLNGYEHHSSSSGSSFTQTYHPALPYTADDIKPYPPYYLDPRAYPYSYGGLSSYYIHHGATHQPSYLDLERRGRRKDHAAAAAASAEEEAYYSQAFSEMVRMPDDDEDQTTEGTGLSEGASSTTVENSPKSEVDHEEDVKGLRGGMVNGAVRGGGDGGRDRVHAGTRKEAKSYMQACSDAPGASADAAGASRVPPSGKSARSVPNANTPSRNDPFSSRTDHDRNEQHLLPSDAPLPDPDALSADFDSPSPAPDPQHRSRSRVSHAGTSTSSQTTAASPPSLSRSSTLPLPQLSPVTTDSGPPPLNCPPNAVSIVEAILPDAPLDDHGADLLHRASSRRSATPPRQATTLPPQTELLSSATSERTVERQLAGLEAEDEEEDPQTEVDVLVASADAADSVTTGVGMVVGDDAVQAGAGSTNTDNSPNQPLGSGRQPTEPSSPNDNDRGAPELPISTASVKNEQISPFVRDGSLPEVIEILDSTPPPMEPNPSSITLTNTRPSPSPVPTYVFHGHVQTTSVSANRNEGGTSSNSRLEGDAGSASKPPQVENDGAVDNEDVSEAVPEHSSGLPAPPRERSLTLVASPGLARTASPAPLANDITQGQQEEAAIVEVADTGVPPRPTERCLTPSPSPTRAARGGSLPPALDSDIPVVREEARGTGLSPRPEARSATPAPSPTRAARAELSLEHEGATVTSAGTDLPFRPSERSATPTPSPARTSREEPALCVDVEGLNEVTSPDNGGTGLPPRPEERSATPDPSPTRTEAVHVEWSVLPAAEPNREGETLVENRASTEAATAEGLDAMPSNHVEEQSRTFSSTTAAPGFVEEDADIATVNEIPAPGMLTRIDGQAPTPVPINTDAVDSVPVSDNMTSTPGLPGLNIYTQQPTSADVTIPAESSIVETIQTDEREPAADAIPQSFSEPKEAAANSSAQSPPHDERPVDVISVDNDVEPVSPAHDVGLSEQAVEPSQPAPSSDNSFQGLFASMSSPDVEQPPTGLFLSDEERDLPMDKEQPEQTGSVTAPSIPAAPAVLAATRKATAQKARKGRQMFDCVLLPPLSSIGVKSSLKKVNLVASPTAPSVPSTSHTLVQAVSPRETLSPVTPVAADAHPTYCTQAAYDPQEASVRSPDPFLASSTPITASPPARVLKRSQPVTPTSASSQQRPRKRVRMASPKAPSSPTGSEVEITGYRLRSTAGSFPEPDIDEVHDVFESVPARQGHSRPSMSPNPRPAKKPRVSFSDDTAGATMQGPRTKNELLPALSPVLRIKREADESGGGAAEEIVISDSEDELASWETVEIKPVPLERRMAGTPVVLRLNRSRRETAPIVPKREDEDIRMSEGDVEVSGSDRSRRRGSQSSKPQSSRKARQPESKRRSSSEASRKSERTVKPMGDWWVTTAGTQGTKRRK